MELLSIIASIGEMDGTFIAIAFVAIAVLWVVFRIVNKNQK